MSVEKPLDIEMFFMRMNTIATKEPSKLGIQAMDRIREHLIEDKREKQKDLNRVTQPSPNVSKKEDTQNKK